MNRSSEAAAAASRLCAIAARQADGQLAPGRVVAQFDSGIAVVDGETAAGFERNQTEPVAIVDCHPGVPAAFNGAATQSSDSRAGGNRNDTTWNLLEWWVDGKQSTEPVLRLRSAQVRPKPETQMGTVGAID